MIIAVCACNASFHDTDIQLMNTHITPFSGNAHHWMWVKDIIITQELKDVARQSVSVRKG